MQEPIKKVKCIAWTWGIFRTPTEDISCYMPREDVLIVNTVTNNSKWESQEEKQ